MPVSAAMAQWHALREQRSDGVTPAPPRQVKKRPAVTKPDQTTVGQVVRDYVSGHLITSRGAASAIAAQRALDRVIDEIGDLPVAAISRAVAFDTLDARKGTPTVAAKLRSLLGAAWDFALDAGRLPEHTPNHWRSIMRGRLKSQGKIIGGKHVGRARRALSAQEVGLLLRWISDMHQLGRDCVVMYLWTGTRGSEFLAMRAENITAEHDGWWWTVPKSQTKNARVLDAVDLRVPLFGRALETVRRRREAVGESGWLFEDLRGEQYTQHDFSTYIYSLMPNSVKKGALKCPVSNWTPHNLRRTARTLLASLGSGDEVGEAILGHLPKEKMIRTYNSYTYDLEKREWLSKLSDHLEALATETGLPARP